MTVPNSDIAKMHITNYTLRNKCQFLHRIGLRYETSPDQFEWLLQDLRARIAAHPMVEETPGFPRVRLVGFGTSSIDIEIFAYVMTPDYGKFLEVQEALVLLIMRTVETAGTSFAFPSQTTYLARDTGLDEEAKHQTEKSVLDRRQHEEETCNGSPS